MGRIVVCIVLFWPKVKSMGWVYNCLVRLPYELLSDYMTSVFKINFAIC